MDLREQLRQLDLECDLTTRALKLSLLVTAAFRSAGYEMVIVGGSAIEFYTDGDYMSGDVDLCFRDRCRPELRVISDIMSRFGATGSSVRTFKIAGLFVDVLGQVESLATTAFREIAGDSDEPGVLIAKPEDLLPERLLMATYPSRNDEALACAKKLAAAGLSGRVAMDWEETSRVAALPEYRVEKELAQLLECVKRDLSRDTP